MKKVYYNSAVLHVVLSFRHCSRFEIRFYSGDSYSTFEGYVQPDTNFCMVSEDAS